MAVDLTAILSFHGKSVVDQIRQNLSSTGTNATSRTSRSVQYTVTTTGAKTIFRVVGRPFFMSVETGRGPTRGGNTGGPTLVESIREWMAARGLKGSPYGIAKVIHEEGTKLYRAGGRKDIVSNVVNESLINRISADVLREFANVYIKVISPV